MYALTLIIHSILLWILIQGACIAQERDTLSFYHSKSGYVFYHNPQIEIQAARFVNPAPGFINQVTVALGGFKIGGTARLRIFGHEGGGPAPVQEEDLIEPIILRKSKAGFEQVVVTIPEHPFVPNNQFFIALDQLDSGVTFLSDNVVKEPFCSSGNDDFYFQLLKENGAWKWEKLSFAVDVVMDYPTVIPEKQMSNVSAAVGIGDTIQSNRSLAWADVDKNGYLDLLWDGRLYLNREGEQFEDVSKSYGLKGTPSANLFADINNDGLIDILFIGSRDSADQRSYLFVGNESQKFTRVDLNLPMIKNPTSFSVADIDRDGYLDLFVGQAGQDTCSDFLLLNDKALGFVDVSARLRPNSLYAGLRSYGSQFIDLDRDGDQDLYIARRYPEHSILLYNDGEGLFTDNTGSGSLHELGAGAGGDWKDFDNDGDLDLLYPRLIHPYLRKYRGAGGSSIYVGSENEEKHFSEKRLPAGTEEIIYEERHAGGSWGDVDNDGLLDAFFGTFGDCRFAELYTQKADYTFRLSTFEYGLHWSSGGEDGIWVDYDNDGDLDLCVIEWNSLRIYKNPGDGGHHSYVEIDPIQESGAVDVGATVTVYAGNLRVTRDVTMGRGILMGDPPRLHYGLGLERSIDSTVVKWSNGLSETFSDVQPNAINRLVQGSTGGLKEAVDASISATPNPFRDQLHIYYTTPQAGRIQVKIYNQTGTLIQTLVDAEMAPGNHSVVWEGEDESGTKVPAGVYIYRLVLQDGEVNGRAVLTR